MDHWRADGEEDGEKLTLSAYKLKIENEYKYRKNLIIMIIFIFTIEKWKRKFSK